MLRFLALACVAATFVAASSDHPYFGDKELSGRMLSTGSVLSKPDLSNWAQEGYALPHEMLRRELFVSHRALKHLDPAKDWHIRAWFTYWAFVVPVVHGHHWAEENVFFPAIISKSGKDLPPQVRWREYGLCVNADSLSHR